MIVVWMVEEGSGADAILLLFLEKYNSGSITVVVGHDDGWMVCAAVLCVVGGR